MPSENKFKRKRILILVISSVVLSIQPLAAHSPDARSWLPFLLPFDIGFVLLLDAFIIIVSNAVFNNNCSFMTILTITTAGNFTAMALWYFEIWEKHLGFQGFWSFMSIPLLTLVSAWAGLLYALWKERQ